MPPFDGEGVVMRERALDLAVGGLAGLAMWRLYGRSPETGRTASLLISVVWLAAFIWWAGGGGCEGEWRSPWAQMAGVGGPEGCRGGVRSYSFSSVPA